MPSIPNINLLPKLANGEYPLPVFHFLVTWTDGDVKVDGSFTEVSGLNREIQLLEYRDGVTKEYSTVKIPGMRKDNNVTLKRGLFHGNNQFYEWWLNISGLKQIERRTVTISLLDTEGQALVSWTLTNAWPLKVDCPAFKADGSEVAIESMELVYESMTIKHESK